MASGPDTVVEEALRKALRDGEVGSTRVVSVHVRRGEDSEGQPALFVELTLTDPPEEAGTWPVDDIWQLRRLVRDAVSGLEGIDLPWFVFFQPEHPGELEPSDVGEQLSV
jgi:hypothetical protein